MSIPSTNMSPIRMPLRGSPGAPTFDGTRIIRFLQEYEMVAEAVNLADSEKCAKIVWYCDPKSELYIKSLPSYKNKKWDDLKNDLTSSYQTDEETPHFSTLDLNQFVAADRSITKRTKFDQYFRDFMVIATYLEEKKHLANAEKNHLFWRGIKPSWLRRELERDLKMSGKWTDLASPPPMKDVVTRSKEILKSDLYHIEDDEDSYAPPKNRDPFERLLRASRKEKAKKEIEPDSDSEDDVAPSFRYREQRKTKDEVSQARPAEPKEEKVDLIKSNVDELNELMKQLRLDVTKLVQTRASRPTASVNSIRCFMCGTDGHVVRECPEVAAMLREGLVKHDARGRLTMGDGSNLPRGTDNTSVAQLIRELRQQSNTASNVELEQLPSFACMNQEIARIGNAEYEVFPAGQSQAKKDMSDKRHHPYERPEKKKENGKQDEPSMKASKTPTQRAFVELPPPPTRRLPPADPPSPANPVEDVDMRDAHDTKSQNKETETKAKGKGPEIAAKSPVNSKREDSTDGSDSDEPKRKKKAPKLKKKVSFEIRDKGDSIAKKRASPAYKFASPLQQAVNPPKLLEDVMDAKISVRLGDLLGSSFELNKALHQISKTQRMPIQKHASTASLETYGLDQHPNFKSDEQTEFFSANLRIQNDSKSDEEQEKDATNKSLSRSPATKLSHHSHKTRGLEVNTITWDSDNDEDGYQSSYDERNLETDSVSSLDTEGEADEYYQKLLQREHENTYIASESQYQFRPSFLAMVTARIQGTVMGMKCTMLVDTGSELNMMVASQQIALELPLDPSGSNWTLRGVSGHQVNLVGLCRNVPIEVGGVALPHNLFVTPDKIGDKEIILGQPWLFSYGARIEYMHDTGMSIQVWKEGDRDDGQSVRVTLPIMNAPRNVFPADLSRSVRNAEIDIPLPGTTPGATDEPNFLNRARAAFDVTTGEFNENKLRPHDLDFEFLSLATDYQFIRNALRRAWHVSEFSAEGELADHVRKVALSNKLTIDQANKASEILPKVIMGTKYKPVGKKVLPIPAYNPDPQALEFKPIEFGDLPPLPLDPPKLEDIVYTNKMTKERLTYMIGKIPKDFLTKTELELLVHLVLKYEDAFAFEDAERGIFDPKYFPPYEMPTVPHVPWQKKHIRLPQGRMGEVLELLQEQFDSGKYERSTSSYRAAWFVVEKKGGLLRIVHDLQPLNGVTIRDASLPPRMDNMIEQFAGRTCYCICDLKGGYEGYLLAEKSRDLTAFHGYGLGTLRHTRLPIGYTNSMQVFCRATSHIVGSMAPHSADVFVDDCAGMGSKSDYGNETIEGNDQIRRFIYEFALVFQELLARMKESGATISGTKAVIATPKLNLLGAVVSKEGAHVSHELNAKLAKWPTCRNPTEVRGFLGTIGVVRKWIRNFSIIAKPLTVLTRKMAPHEFEWTSDAQAAMNELKELAAKAVPIRSIDYKLAQSIRSPDQRTSDEGLVSIAVDSSIIGVGWIVSQKIEGKDYPIVFGSITFNDVESRYSQPKLELYGVFRALNAERHRLHGIHFRLLLDASYIGKMINNPDLPNAAMTRWIAYTRLFDFEIVHNPTNKHRGPDGLSRRRRADDDSDDTEEEIDVEEGIKLISLPKYEFDYYGETNRMSIAEAESDAAVTDQLQKSKLNRLMGECKALEVGWSDPRDLRKVTDSPFITYEGKITVSTASESETETLEHKHRKDEYDNKDYWNEILAYLLNLTLPSDKKRRTQIVNRAKRFFIHEEMLWRRNGDKPPLQVVLSEDVRKRICRDAHDDSGHRGRDPTYRKIRDSYWWPNMYLTIARYCQTCHECQIRSDYRETVPVQPQYTHTLLRRFDTDLVTMPQGKNGYRYIVDLVDNLTGFTEATKLRTKSADLVAQFMFDVMCRYGCIFQLTTDNGNEFQGAVQILMDKYKVPVVRISAYNPRANGKSERGHGVWIKAIWKIVGKNISKWPDYIGYALWADRVTAKRTTGYSPYYLLYGQHPLMPYDVRDKTFHALDWPSVTTTEDLLALRIIQLSKRDELLDDAVKSNNVARKKAADAFNRKHGARMAKGDYKRGEWVIIYDEALKNQYGRKGEPNWFGPFIIVSKRPSGAYIVQQPDGVVLKTPIAWKRLKLYHFRENTEPIIREPIWAPDPYKEDDAQTNDNDQDLYESNAIKIRPLPKKSWTLRGEDAWKYWDQKYDLWHKKLANGEYDPSYDPEGSGEMMRDDQPRTEFDIALDAMIREDNNEFWYRDYDFPYSCSEDNVPRFKKGVLFSPHLLQTEPNGCPWRWLLQPIVCGRSMLSANLEADELEKQRRKTEIATLEPGKVEILMPAKKSGQHEANTAGSAERPNPEGHMRTQHVTEIVETSFSSETSTTTFECNMAYRKDDKYPRSPKDRQNSGGPDRLDFRDRHYSPAPSDEQSATPRSTNRRDIDRNPIDDRHQEKKIPEYDRTREAPEHARAQKERNLQRVNEKMKRLAEEARILSEEVDRSSPSPVPGRANRKPSPAGDELDQIDPEPDVDPESGPPGSPAPFHSHYYARDEDNVKPFVEVTREVVDQMRSIDKALGDHSTHLRKVHSDYRNKVHTSTNALKALELNTHALAKKVADLMDEYCQYSTNTSRFFTSIEAGQEDLVRSTLSLKTLLLNIHHDTLTPNDYYLAVREILKGAIPRIAEEYKFEHQKIKSLRSASIELFGAWNELAPNSIHDGVWVSEIDRIINDKRTQLLRDGPAPSTEPRTAQIKLKIPLEKTKKKSESEDRRRSPRPHRDGGPSKKARKN